MTEVGSEVLAYDLPKARYQRFAHHKTNSSRLPSGKVLVARLINILNKANSVDHKCIICDLLESRWIYLLDWIPILASILLGNNTNI